MPVPCRLRCDRPRGGGSWACHRRALVAGGRAAAHDGTVGNVRGAGVAGALSLAYTVLTRIRWSHRAIDEHMDRLQAITDPGPLLLALRPARYGWAPATAIGLILFLAAVGAADGRRYVLLLGFALALGLFALGYGRGPAVAWVG